MYIYYIFALHIPEMNLHYLYNLPLDAGIDVYLVMWFVCMILILPIKGYLDMVMNIRYS